MSKVIILHGYSDTWLSFKPLRDFLGSHGFATVDIVLGNYVSLEDTVTIADLAKAFARALADNNVACTEHSFDLVVHSTGSLVAREWLTRYYLEAGLPCPVRHYLMLAPANFGSPLGHVGKTMLGRIIKGWKSDFQSGTQVLNALELGSPFTWNLARRDLFGPRSFYRPEDCLAAVLVGSKPYQTGLRQLVDKNGGDGTVFVSTANLNATGLRLALGRKGHEPAPEPWPRRAAPVAFGVFPDRDHGSITRPDDGPADLGAFIVDFLRLQTPADYEAFRTRCSQRTAATLPPAPSDDIYHSYENLVVRVSDDLGFPVRDYFLEFYERPRRPADETRIDSLMLRVHKEVLEGVHVYGDDASYRSLLFDLTDLRATLAEGQELVFSASAAPLSELIGYSAGADNDVGEYPVADVDASPFWQPNATVLLELVLDRTQTSETFALRQ